LAKHHQGALSSCSFFAVRGIDFGVNLPGFLPFFEHRLGMGSKGYFWSKTIGTNRLAGQNVSKDI
jgi:hypothetical protein